MSREETVALLHELKLSAIVRSREGALARDAMKAAVAGGFRVVEFTLTTPDALRLVAEFARDSRLLVGAGTVLSARDAARARDAGARFVVSPVLDPDVLQAARELGLATMPGTFTATEMWAAHQAGADVVKLFPGPADVPAYVASILGPLPMLRIFPTNGVGTEDFPAVLDAGAAGIGFVKPLFHPDDMARRNFAAIERRAAAIHERFERWQGARS